MVELPWLTQPDYDRLLWSADLNFVRGEDSLVRAIWAGCELRNELNLAVAVLGQGRLRSSGGDYLDIGGETAEETAEQRGHYASRRLQH